MNLFQAEIGSLQNSNVLTCKSNKTAPKAVHAAACGRWTTLHDVERATQQFLSKWSITFIYQKMQSNIALLGSHVQLGHSHTLYDHQMLMTFLKADLLQGTEL